jgi:hypothetical protein
MSRKNTLPHEFVFALDDGDGCSLLSRFQEKFCSRPLYSAPSLCFSAAGAIAGMLFFWIKAFKEASSLDWISCHAASCDSSL